MEYTIKEVSEMFGQPIPTLRYYDKMGLLPGLKRKDSGYRIFSEGDIEMIKIIDSFNQAGFQIKDIQNYISLALKGDVTLQERYEIFLKQEQALLDKMQALQNALSVTQKKLTIVQQSKRGQMLYQKHFVYAYKKLL